MLATHFKERTMVFRDDAEAVSFVAGLLDISEFRLFEMAYASWFGRDATEKALDGFFGTYLKSGLIPFWVRNMVRTVMCEYRKGNWTPSRFGIDQPCISPSQRRLGWILVGLFYLLIFVIVWGSATFKSM
jgi:hypothetical protein